MYNPDTIQQNTSKSEVGEDQPALDLVYRLCKSLEAEEILYCHWKSNAALDRSLSGENDLDLLVSRDHVRRFSIVLFRLGFKEALVSDKEDIPGIRNFYGYDQAGDRLIHVHVHYLIVLGQDMTKNYRLPIEEPFLASANQDRLLKVPSPEFEFVVFVMRMVLKHSTWDSVFARQGALSKAERQELAYLQTRVNRPTIFHILEQHVPFVDPQLFDALLRGLQPGCPVWIRLRTAQQLQSRLRAQANRPQFLDTGLKLWRRGVKAIRRRVFSGLPRKRLAAGGILIAIVGGDGAGKSTVVNDLHAWLSKDFATMTTHMGRPPWSLFSKCVRGILKLWGWVHFPRRFRRAGQSNLAVEYPSMWRAVCVAYDRYLSYREARRFAIRGGLVICDRFPLPQIELMDGPRIRRAGKADVTIGLAGLLITLEKKLYKRIMPPDILIVLRVEPMIAVKRKTDEDAISVRTRSTEVWNLDWQDTTAHVIDAGRSRKEVLSELKSLLWSIL